MIINRIMHQIFGLSRWITPGKSTYSKNILFSKIVHSGISNGRARISTNKGGNMSSD